MTQLRSPHDHGQPGGGNRGAKRESGRYSAASAYRYGERLRLARHADGSDRAQITVLCASGPADRGRCSAEARKKRSLFNSVSRTGPVTLLHRPRQALGWFLVCRSFPTYLLSFVPLFPNNKVQRCGFTKIENPSRSPLNGIGAASDAIGQRPPFIAIHGSHCLGWRPLSGGGRR